MGISPLALSYADHHGKVDYHCPTHHGWQLSPLSFATSLHLPLLSSMAAGLVLSHQQINYFLCFFSLAYGHVLRFHLAHSRVFKGHILVIIGISSK